MHVIVMCSDKKTCAYIPGSDHARPLPPLYHLVDHVLQPAVTDW